MKLQNKWKSAQKQDKIKGMEILNYKEKVEKKVNFSSEEREKDLYTLNYGDPLQTICIAVNGR